MATFKFSSRNKNTTVKKEVKPRKRSNFFWVIIVIMWVLVWALVLRTYSIPTSSMEKSLLVGDYLFVSKLHYGFPSIGISGFSQVKNNDMVVFNWPVDATKFIYQKTNYIKRCIGIGGDSIEIRKSEVFVNGKAAQVPAGLQSSYLIMTDQVLDDRTFWKNDITDFTHLSHTSGYMVQTSEQVAKLFADFDFIKQVVKQEDKPGEAAPYIFPHNSKFAWNVDNFGPLWIPKEDATIELNPKNVILYGKTIIDYEKLKNAEIRDSLLYIDGVLAKTHTFGQNYYFMMGDNRHNSQDSRFWGFVPKDHIVGKAWLVWLSIDPNKSSFFSIRYKRIFKFIE